MENVVNDNIMSLPVMMNDIQTLLIRRLDDSDSEMVIAAIQAAGYFRTRMMISALIDRLVRFDSAALIWVYKVLPTMGAQVASEFLLDILETWKECPDAAYQKRFYTYLAALTYTVTPILEERIMALYDRFYLAAQRTAESPRDDPTWAERAEFVRIAHRVLSFRSPLPIWGFVLLSQLIKDPHPKVRLEAIRTLNTNLQRLAGAPIWEVRPDQDVDKLNRPRDNQS